MSTTTVQPRKKLVHAATKAELLTATIPSPDFVKKYVGRTIGGRTDFDIFDAAYENDWNVLIEGPTGPGKTTAVKAFAGYKGLPFYRIPSNVGFDPAQFYGKYLPVEGGLKGEYHWVDGPVTVLAKTGGILLINEINFLPSRVATVTFGLLDESREIMLLDHMNEVIHAHSYRNCWCGKDRCDKALIIFADMNPDYEGTRQLNAALRNRFDIQLDWDYDVEVEEKLIGSPILRELMGNLRASVASDIMRTPVSTNMGMEFERISKQLGYDFAVQNFANHFAVDEREAVTRAFEAMRDRLVPTIPIPEETPAEEALRRSRMKDGDYDPELGVLGKDWVWTADEDEADVVVAVEDFDVDN